MTRLLTRPRAAQLAVATIACLWWQMTLTGTPWASTITALAALATAWPTAFWAAHYTESRRHTCHMCADIFAGHHPGCRTNKKAA